MSTYQETHEQRAAEAARTMEKHEYQALALTEKCQVWRCNEPGTSCYAFDIMLTRFGIAVVGDIDSLTFRVGLSYGIDFLAGSDVTYYIHSKLDEDCKAREIDEPKIRQLVYEWGQAGLERDLDIDVPEFQGPEALAQLIDWTHKRQQADSESTYADVLRDWVTLLESASSLIGDGDLREIQEFLNRNADKLCEEWWDYTMTKPTDTLIQRLYLVRHAALQIQKQLAQKGNDHG